MDSTIQKKLANVCGKDNVLANKLDLFLYGYDASIEKGLPAAVVFPQNSAQVRDIVKIAIANKLPFTARGSATNLCGGSVAYAGGIIIECSHMQDVYEIDIPNRVAVVGPGLFNLDLQELLAPYGYFFPPDPASQKVSTLAGNVAMNAGGPHCLKYGVTVNHVLGVELVTPDGELVQFGGKTMDASGYDMVGVLNGSEGTLGIITKLWLKISPKPESLETMLVSFDNIHSAARTVSDIIAHGIIPATLEYMDNLSIRTVVESMQVDYPKEAAAVLIIEVDGHPATLHGQISIIREICVKHGAGEFRRATDETERAALWAGRRGALGAMTRLAPSIVVFDGTVPRPQLPKALQTIDDICKKHDLTYGTLLHAGDGNIHPILVYDERDQAQFKRVMQGCKEIMQLCIDLGGTITGEHGVGLEKKKALSMLFREQDLAAMSKLKTIFDPGQLCNPGKIFNNA